MFTDHSIFPSLFSSSNESLLKSLNHHLLTHKIITNHKSFPQLYSSISQSNYHDQRSRILAACTGTGLALFAGHIIYQEFLKSHDCAAQLHYRRKRSKKPRKLDASTMVTEKDFDVLNSIDSNEHCQDDDESSISVISDVSEHSSFTLDTCDGFVEYEDLCDDTVLQVIQVPKI